MDLVKQAGVRQQYIDQSVSLNLDFPSIATPKWINQVTMELGNKGLKHCTIQGLNQFLEVILLIEQLTLIVLHVMVNN